MNRTTTIWIVLGIVVLAILALLAFNRPADTDALQEETVETATTTVEAIDSAAVRAGAAAELTALRARAEAGETYDSLADDFAEVRDRVAVSYENAEGAAAEEWAELSADFAAFEASARAGTGDFLSDLSDLIERLSADVRFESDAEATVQ